MNTKTQIILTGGALVFGVFLVLRSDVKKAAVAAAEAINPVSNQNVIYKGVSGVVGAVTGDSSTSLGSKIYDWLHPDEGI